MFSHLHLVLLTPKWKYGKKLFFMAKIILISITRNSTCVSFNDKNHDKRFDFVIIKRPRRRGEFWSPFQSWVKITKTITARPTWHNRESRNDLTPFWVFNCVGAECAGAGAGAGSTEILDLFAIFGNELDEFRLDIGVVWPTFFGIRSDSVFPSSTYECFFPFFSVCFRQVCFSVLSVFRVEIVVDLDICSSVIRFRSNGDD